MTKILGLCGSPVEGSSTSIIIKTILESATEAGAMTDYISLNELNIMPCQACGKSPEDNYCYFGDGMDIIYNKFEWCDAIIVGSPIYFDSVSAQTKLFIDRCNCLRHFLPEKNILLEPRIKKKRKGAIVLVGGPRQKFEYARRVIGGFFIWANIESAGLIKYSHDGPQKGTVADSRETLDEAIALGRFLAE